MRKVERQCVLSLDEYEKIRPQMRAQMMKVKEFRRVHVGQHLTFLFENFDTTLYQIHEMIRTERMIDEAQIIHEVETYNEVIGEQGELGCTLLIEIDNPEQRQELLSRWLDLPKYLFIRAEDGSLIRPTFDERQIGSSRISSVHYLRFPMGDKIPSVVGCDHPDINAGTKLTTEQMRELCNDLLARR